MLAARASGVDPNDRDLVLEILSLAFEPGDEGAGILRLVLAGDGEIALDVECLDVTLDGRAAGPTSPGRGGARGIPLD